MTTEDLAKALRDLQDQRAVVDALYRFAAGQDLKDEALFHSAFTADAVLDFSQPASRFGVEMPPLKGIDAILQIPVTLAELRTTHTVTNPRVVLADDSATLTALVEAQHVRDLEEGHLLLKNVYDVDLRRASEDAAVWRIWHMEIRNIWFDGDPTVLFPLSG